MNRTKHGIRFAILFLAAAHALLSGPSHVFSQEGANPDYGEAMITMDFQEVDLTVLIKFLPVSSLMNLIRTVKSTSWKSMVIMASP